MVVTLGLISGCGVVDNAGDRLAQPASRESQTVDRQESPENAIGADNPDMNSDIPLISGQESRLVTLQGSHAPSPGTVTELVTDETVVVGDVIASRYGETGGPRDDRVTPIYVTIRVVERIIGNRDIPNEFQYWAQDVLVDGGLLVEEGHPWLNVGDRVLMGVVEQGGPDILYTNVSP